MRITGPLLKVLAALMDRHRLGEEVYGLDIIRETGLASGTVYPLLDRLVEANLLEARFETPDEKTKGRPRRRYYRLTGTGVAQAQTWLSEHTFSERSVRWAF